MTIAVAAGNSCWRWYESGILTTDMNCPTSIDHGVVIVGLVKAGSDGDDGGDHSDASFTASCREVTPTESNSRPGQSAF